ncbi:MAG: glycosyltransferase family 39 protein [Candidatus Krumholzibacteriota bacterium]|nr:glycosyltransferase family 39 protein [Candidatus Krumholzibacteriota bacterium]
MAKVSETKNHIFLDLWRDRIVPSFSKDWDLLAVIILLSLSLRLYFAFSFDSEIFFGFKNDFFEIAKNGTIGPERAPLYLLFLRMMLLLFRDGAMAAGFAIQGIINSISVLLIYFIASRIFNRKTALVAASLGAIYPNFILANLSLTPGSFEIFIVLALITAALSETGDMARSAISSALVGIAMMLDPIMAFLIPGTILAMKKRLAFFLILIGILFPLTIRNSIVEKRVVPVYRAEAYELDFSKFKPTRLKGRWNTVAQIYNNASYITSKEWALSDDEGTDQNTNSTYTAAYAYTVLMVLGIIGLARYYRKEERNALLPVAFYTVLMLILTSFSKRYRIPFEPLFVIYASAILCRCRSGVSGIPAADQPDPAV